jgi:lysophospholipase L1-like esterase
MPSLVTSGSLPAGLTLSSGGLLSGTPTAGGTFNFTVTATDSSGCSQAKAYNLTIKIDVVVFGSSVAKGVGSSGYTNSPQILINGSYSNGYAALMTAFLANNGLMVTNASLPGDSSSGATGRFSTAVVPLSPRYVLIGYSLGNDGLAGTTGGG